MNVINADKNELVKRLRSLFGSYRAEWSQQDMFRHFSEPAYFSDLVNFRPCVLQGGRGSGKTTALRGLTYQGQYELIGSNVNRFDSEVPFVGLYHKIDTNHVRAFSGGNVGEEVWRKLFGHYFNLMIIVDIIDFLVWHAEKRDGDDVLTANDMQQILRRLCINADCANYETLDSIVNNALCDFQNIINNIGSFDSSMVRLSLIGEPIDFILSKIRCLGQFQNKRFYLLLDEYENFEDYQQVIINTMITHIKDVDLNDYMIVVRDVGNAASESFYIAAFPTKRYLTAHGFAKLLGRMNRFKLMRSSLPESNDREFRPTLACSATWLCSYRNLKHAFRGAGLDIDFESCYFHKCYGSLPKNSGEEKRLIGFDVALAESQVSIAKDKAFNKLGLQDRLRLLETMNVHDLLLFATKSPPSRLHRWCRGI